MRAADKLRKLKAEKDAAFQKSIDHLEALSDETFRIGEQFENIVGLLDDIDKEFSKATGICNKKDLSLLFVATGLLCAKWIIMGQCMKLNLDFSYKDQEKLNSRGGDDLAKDKRKQDKKYGNLRNESNKSEEGFRTVNQIIFNPVPYDAQRKIEGGNLSDIRFKPNGKLNSSNHRAYSLGHDEILGWIFGTFGIMTRSMTLKFPTLDTFEITEKGILISEPSNLGIKIKEAWEMFNLEHERLYAAVFKQGLHFLSDKFTATGLPLTFMSADAYLKRLKQGWDPVAYANSMTKFKKIAGMAAKDTGIITVQFIISVLINEIIKAIHLFLYEKEKDGDIRLYQTRTRKILLAANCISSTSNVLFCTGIAVASRNPLEAASRLDIGGFIETVHRLIADTKFIREIKREYIQERLYEKIYETDFNWLYEL